MTTVCNVWELDRCFVWYRLEIRNTSCRTVSLRWFFLPGLMTWADGVLFSTIEHNAMAFSVHSGQVARENRFRLRDDRVNLMRRGGASTISGQFFGNGAIWAVKGNCSRCRIVFYLTIHQAVQIIPRSDEVSFHLFTKNHMFMLLVASSVSHIFISSQNCTKLVSTQLHLKDFTHSTSTSRPRF